MVVGWYLKWIEGRDLLPGRESAVRFWRESVRAKKREEWQLEQWAAAMEWYLEWLGAVERERGMAVVPSLPMRVRRAVIRKRAKPYKKQIATHAGGGRSTALARLKTA
jgi:hypothetical protein